MGLARELDELHCNLARAADSMQVCVDYERAISHPDADNDAAIVADLRRRAASPSPDLPAP